MCNLDIWIHLSLRITKNSPEFIFSLKQIAHVYGMYAMNDQPGKQSEKLRNIGGRSKLKL